MQRWAEEMKSVEEYKAIPWCTCNGSGKCMGCEIQKKVQECYGKDGLNFLLAHIKEGDKYE